MTTYDFANILFSGPCNQRCPYCIGKLVDPALNQNNLNLFPLRGLDRFAALLRQHGIRQITLSGTNTDPQLYRHEARLIEWLRENLPGVRLSLHTNGQLALQKIDVFNLYDRATISFPSFDPETFFQMTGVRHIPDLAAIVRASRIPIKLSCVLDTANIEQVPEILAHCHQLGIRRVALRELFGRPVPWHPPAALRPNGAYRNNPVYDHQGIQVTLWRFEHTSCTSLNLFADGSISGDYLLTS